MAGSPRRLPALLLLAAASISGALGQASVQVLPPTQVVRPGDTVHLMCRTGVPIAYCRMENRVTGASWFLRENATDRGAETPVYEGAGYAQGQCGMVVRNATEELSGAWGCTMGTTVGSVSEIRGNATVVVAKAPMAPELVVSPNGQTGNGYEFKPGDTLRARCTVRNGRPAANISWYIGDDEIMQGASQPEEIRNLDNTWTASQNISRELRWQDNGKRLRCVAQHLAYDDRSSNQSTYEIKVLFPPQPHSSPIERFGFEVGAEGVVTVTVEANPAPSLVWEVGDQSISQGNSDTTNHYQAGMPIDLGGGLWEATLRITQVEAQDIDKTYRLRATNSEGSVTYSIALSTSSEPEVLALGAGAIIGIVVAILVLLLAIFLVVFARATGRWCFAGGVSSSQNDIRESSDTESADHGHTHRPRRPKMNIGYIFNKKKDKVADETVETQKAEVEPPTPTVTDTREKKTQGRGDVVYAELDLKEMSGKPRPQVRPEEERTEYAEILYTAKEEDAAK